MIGGLALYVLVGAAVNFWVDPWEVWRKLPSDWVIPRDTNFERVTLANNIRNAKRFDVLLLGSSRAVNLMGSSEREVDIQASAPFFGERRVFIASLAGTNIYSKRRILEHALHYHPVREVVLLIDDVMMNVHRPNGIGWQESNYFGSLNYQTTMERMLSLADFSMLHASVGLLHANMLRASAQGDSKLGNVDDFDARWRAEMIRRTEEFRRRDLYGCFEITQKPRNELGRFLELAKQNNVRVTIISSFIHPLLFEFSYRSDNGQAQRDFLSALKDAADRHNVPTWFFSPLSPIVRSTLRTEPLRRPPGNPDFDDVGHVNAQMAKMLLERALKGVNRDDLKGYRLNDTTIDEVITDVQAQRELWDQGNYLIFEDHLKSNPLIARQECPSSRASPPRL